MMDQNQECPPLRQVVGARLLEDVASRLADSCEQTQGINNVDGSALPRRGEIIRLADQLLEITFPGFDGERCYSSGKLKEQFAELIEETGTLLLELIRRAYRHGCGGTSCEGCILYRKSVDAVKTLLEEMPSVREAMRLDVAAAYAGDPAAKSHEEIILSYPCIKTITVQRYAHLLFGMGVPLIPRMMTEYVHSLTGIDIHPGAVLGRGVFIDHGTGVVIGETARIGDNVRIYQGVTLGALSFPKDACGVLVKGNRRHPTIGSNVTIYAGATILGDIEVGSDSVIGGNVWLTESLPPGTKITARIGDHHIKYASGGDK